MIEGRTTAIFAKELGGADIANDIARLEREAMNAGMSGPEAHSAIRRGLKRAREVRTSGDHELAHALPISGRNFDEAMTKAFAALAQFEARNRSIALKLAETADVSAFSDDAWCAVVVERLLEGNGPLARYLAKSGLQQTGQGSGLHGWAVGVKPRPISPVVVR